MCRQTISLVKLFARKAFEPTDEELGVSSDLDAFNINWEVDTATGEGRYKAQATAKRKARKSDPIDDGSDLDDFIVDDDEPIDNRSYKSKPKRASRGKSRQIIISDDEDEEDKKEDRDTYINSDEDDDIEDIEIATKKSKAKQKISRKGVIQSDSEEEATISRPSRSSRVDVVNKPTMIASFMPSTKMQYMMKKLLEVAETHPDDKVKRLRSSERNADH